MLLHEDCYACIIKFVNAPTFKAMLLVSRMMRKVIAPMYARMIDIFCNHNMTIIARRLNIPIIDGKMDVDKIQLAHLPRIPLYEVRGLTVGHVRRWHNAITAHDGESAGQMANLLTKLPDIMHEISMNPEFTYEDIKANEDIFNMKSFCLNPNCDISQMKSCFPFLSDNVEWFTNYYSAADLREIMRDAADMQCKIEVAMVLHKATKWEVIAEFPCLMELLDDYVGCNILTDAKLKPTQILDQTGDEIYWDIDNILIDVTLTDDLYERYHGDAEKLRLMSSNPTVTEDFVVGREWYWPELTMNIGISIGFILANMNMPWYMKNISCRHDITISIIVANPQIEWDWEDVSYHCQLSSHEFFKYQCPWHVGALLRNPSITMPIVNAVTLEK